MKWKYHESFKSGLGGFKSASITVIVSISRLSFSSLVALHCCLLNSRRDRSMQLEEDLLGAVSGVELSLWSVIYEQESVKRQGDCIQERIMCSGQVYCRVLLLSSN